MSPAATLVYVQNFFAWITAEALHGRPGIVDKYIGDEVMVVFSDEFGSEEPFLDAVRAAAAISENDAHAYCPHIGIASGPVIVGYAGTALRYNVSVFGAPVALAARCAAVKPAATGEQRWVSLTIVMQAGLSNPEIAVKLVLSRRTVATHVSPHLEETRRPYADRHRPRISLADPRAEVNGASGRT
ncbi:MAG TPA: hypothetical protein VHS32_24375 [Streptosporangiaceae bacterium]|nr:hypothetical protein [Streptosporangiaceae bacterium]